ncbi:hypothetical protein T439DRAFT_321040 [Meredithblackwellia eburnea MCA 4105]
MCRSTGAISYGLSVTASSLIVAAHAHSNIHKQLTTIAILKLRQSRATLVSSTPDSKISLISVETWDIIKRFLIDIALQDALHNWLNRLRCQACREDGEQRRARRKAKKARMDGSSSMLVKRTSTIPDFEWHQWGEPPKCQSCLALGEYDSEVLFLEDKHQKPIKALLDSYGLQYLRDSTSPRSDLSDIALDPRRGWDIGIPMYLDKEHLPTAAEMKKWVSEDYYDSGGSDSEAEGEDSDSEDEDDVAAQLLPTGRPKEEKKAPTFITSKWSHDNYQSINKAALVPVELIKSIYDPGSLDENWEGGTTFKADKPFNDLVKTYRLEVMDLNLKKLDLSGVSDVSQSMIKPRWKVESVFWECS